MSSVAGGVIFAVVSLLLISCAVLLILRHYLPLRTTPGYLLVPVFLALALPVGLILLVPIDLASSLKEEGQSQGIWLPERVIRVAWRIAYWLTFCLTWFILPLLGEYVDSGYRTPKDRILYSLRSNARYQLITLGCGLLGLAYIFWQNGFDDGTHIKSLVMALAYCVGLVQAVLLLGHGLVAVPRYFFRNQGTRLQRLQARAPKVKDKLDDSILEMQDLNKQMDELKSRKRGLSRDMEDWIDEIADGGRYTVIVPTSAIPSNHNSRPVPAVITDRYIADTARRLNRARHKVVRFTNEWHQLVNDAQDLQRVIDSYATKRLELPSDSKAKFFRGTLLTPHIRYLIYCRIFPVLRIVLGVLLASASISIIWSELVKVTAPQISMVSLTVVRHTNGDPKVGFGGQLISFIWIMYMCTCTLSSLQDIKVWGNRALVPRNTYYESACWYSLQVAKLTVPLTYNFLTFTPVEVRKKTIFYDFLGQNINFTPLGNGFDYIFPMFILLPAAATLFHVYGRVKKILGYGVFEDDDEESSFGTGTWREGRQLIEQEIQDRAHTNSAGLTNRVHADPFSDQLQETRREPTIYVPPGEDRRTAQRQAERLAAATQAAEEADENFFSDFAHRVRNTIDNVERPDWLPEFGKRPKWMGGGDDDNEHGNQGPASDRRDSNSIGRFFGIKKGSSGGRIRL